MPNFFVSASNEAFPVAAEVLLLYPWYHTAARRCQQRSCSLYPKSTRCNPKEEAEGLTCSGSLLTDWQAVDWASHHRTKSKAVSLPWQANLPSLTSAIGNKALHANSRWNLGKNTEKLLSIADVTFWTCWWFVTLHPLDLAPNQLMAPNTSGYGRGPHCCLHWSLRGTVAKGNKPYR